MSSQTSSDTENIEKSVPELSWKEALFQTMKEVAFVFTPDGTILDWNQQVVEVTGYTNDEISSMHPVEFVPERERDFIREMIETVLSTGRVTFEADFLSKDQRTIPYEFHGFLLERNQRKFIYGMGRDITQRRRNTETVRRATESYHRLFEQAREGIVVTTPEGSITDVNPAFCRLMGYSEEELRGMYVRNLYADPRERRRLVRLLRDQKRHHDFRARALRKDGTTMICHLSATTWTSPTGETEAFQTFVRDVTEEIEARQALQESEEKFRTLAEQAPVGIGIIQDGQLQYVNRAHAEMLGYTRDELTGASPEVYVHSEDQTRVKTEIRRRIDGEVDAVEYSFRAQTKDGEIRIIEVRGGTITYEGRPAVVGTLVDVTERRRLQREILSVQEEERERVGQDLHDAVGSHLSGTTMALRVLSNKAEDKCPDLADELKRITSLVHESSRDAQRLSRGLNPMGLREEGLKFALERLAINTKEEVRCRFKNCEDLSLSADAASHLYWIAQEAVTNARKYAEADRITISLVRQEHQLTLMVEDDGQGFESSRPGEEGLGLRTMQYRVELLGGTLTIETEPGEGTLVEVRTPCP